MASAPIQPSGKEKFTAAIGPRAAVKLCRRMGGAGRYIPAAKPDHSQIRPEEVEPMKELYLRGYCFNEIAPLVGRSVQTVAGLLKREVWDRRLPRFPSPQSFEGRVLRAELRAGASLEEARAATEARKEAWLAPQRKRWERYDRMFDPITPVSEAI